MAVDPDRTVEPAAHHAGPSHGGHPSPREYVRSGAVLIPTLLVLALVKFALVVMWFMHLRFDDRRYARFFVTGLSGAAALYLIVLITFGVFA